MRVAFETTEVYFTGLVVAGHLDDDSITIELDAEYADEGRSGQRVTVNPDYCTVEDSVIADCNIAGQAPVTWIMQDGEHVIRYGREVTRLTNNREAAANFWSSVEHSATCAEIASNQGEI